jgi:hypothetical protein
LETYMYWCCADIEVGLGRLSFGVFCKSFGLPCLIVEATVERCESLTQPGIPNCEHDLGEW